MKKLFLSGLLILLLACAVLFAVACDKPDDDGPVEDEHSFWLQEENVFSPTDIQRTGTDKNVSALYQDIKVSKPANVVLTSGEQALALKKVGDAYVIEVYIVNGEDYVPLFTTEVKELVPGFGQPTSYETKTVDGNEAVVMKGGNGTHTFTLTCTALKETGLIHFEMDTKLGATFNFTRLDFGFAMAGEPAVSYGQLPVSIYGNMWNYDSVGLGMPAAYLWDKGREAVVLFDYTDMTWMNSDVYLPGRQGYVDAKTREGGYTSFGLCYGNDKNGNPHGCGHYGVPASIKVEFYLFAGLSAQRQGVSCIARKAEVMAPVHPTSVTYPAVRRDLAGKVKLSWEAFADGTVPALLHPAAQSTAAYNFKDVVLTSEKRVLDTIIHHPRQTSEEHAHSDFSCNYNWVSSLAAYNRIKNNAEVAELLTAKMDALQFYYDPDADMIRYGLRMRNLVGTYEMPWQNGFYHVETYRSVMHASVADYSPGALSNLLSALKGGTTELIQALNYVLPQWTDPVNKKAETQQDVPALVTVYEPWQIGSYAYAYLKAYDVTGDKSYVDLASKALSKVINDVSFKVKNNVYTKTYTDSAEFPITELFGSANGVYACYRIFEITGEEKWLTYSEAFFGMLAQLTFWYDDNLSGAAKTSTWVGLFEPHGGASHPCPWESIEAVLPLTEVLDATGDYLFNDLILAIMNTQRVSSYNFYPVVWSNAFASHPAYNQEEFFYVPTEPMYNSFAGGNSDTGAVYMSSLSFWNYLMYEAFATVNDKDVMILNTDVQADFESAVQGAERHFVLYNPKSTEVTVTMTHKELPAGNYTVTVEGGESKTYTADELKAGVSYTLPALTDLRIRVVAEDRSLLAAASRDTMTRYRLATAYNAVVEKVQGIAAESLGKIFPDVSENLRRDVANYVLTYVSYEDAMALALNSTSVGGARKSYLNRELVIPRVKKLYTDRTDLHLPEEYTVLIQAVDEATSLYRKGDSVEAYNLADAIVKALASGTEKDFAASRTGA